MFDGTGDWRRTVLTPWHLSPASGQATDMSDLEVAKVRHFQDALAELIEATAPWLPVLLHSADAQMVAEDGRLFACYRHRPGFPVVELTGIDTSGLPWANSASAKH